MNESVTSGIIYISYHGTWKWVIQFLLLNKVFFIFERGQGLFEAGLRGACAQSCKKRETLHDPEIFIQNFTPTISHKIKWASKVKNYRTTKKGSVSFCASQTSLKFLNVARLKKL